MHQRAEAPSARPLEVAAFDPLNVNTRLGARTGSFAAPAALPAAERTSDVTVWTRQRWLGGLCEQRLALRLPRRIVPLALRGGGAVRIRLEDALVPQRRELLDIEGKDGRVPPHDRCATRHRHVQTGPDRTRRPAVCPSVPARARSPRRRPGNRVQAESAGARPPAGRAWD